MFKPMSVFSISFGINVGVIPGGGAISRLVRWVGKCKTMEILLTGDMFDAKEAERIGIGK